MKILFLEDRPSRQRIFLPQKDKDVEKIKSLDNLTMPEGSECKEILSEINQGKYNFSEGLQLIIIHKSALKTEGLKYLNDICKEKKIKLVCYSGGTSQLIYNNDDFEMLNINSTDFYSIRLIPFLERAVGGQIPHLVELANQQWELSYLFLARQILGSLKLETDEYAKDNLHEKFERIQRIVNCPSDEKELNKIIKEKILQL